MSLPAAALALLGLVVRAANPVRLPPAQVRSGAPAAILLDLRLPQGWRLDPAAPVRWRFSETWAGFAFVKRKGEERAPRNPLRIPFSAAPGATGARLRVDYRRCRGSLCADRSLDFLVVVSASPEEPATEIPVRAHE